MRQFRGNLQKVSDRPMLMNIALIVCLCLWSGCGKQAGRVQVFGTITVDGRPFFGSINFRPTAGNDNPVVMMHVEKGEYRFTSQNGPGPGVYQVVIEMSASGQKGASAVPVEPFVWTFEEIVSEEHAELNFQVSEQTQQTEQGQGT